MSDVSGIFVAQGEHPLHLLLRLANRHGLVAGATGTGKSVTLQVMAEGFSRLGVPVFLADVKGDLAGLSQPGEPKPRLVERAKEIGVELSFAAFPVVFGDLFGEQGHPIRTTVSDVGPLLLSRLLDLNEVQSGVLNLAVKLADDEGLLLLDLKDLRALLVHVAENAKRLTLRYGAVNATSVGAIQRALLVLEQQGAERFFGEPALDLGDLLQLDAEGRGVVSVLAAERLLQSPRLYATFLLWLLSELGVGEALVSFLEASGSPAVVERAKVRPPQSRLGPVTPEERATTIAKSPIGRAYDQLVDRESAFERLTARAETAAAAATKAPRPTISPGRARESAGEAMVKSVVRSVGTQLGRQIVRGLLGSILRR